MAPAPLTAGAAAPPAPCPAGTTLPLACASLHSPHSSKWCRSQRRPCLLQHPPVQSTSPRLDPVLSESRLQSPHQRPHPRGLTVGVQSPRGRLLGTVLSLAGKRRGRCRHFHNYCCARCQSAGLLQWPLRLPPDHHHCCYLAHVCRCLALDRGRWSTETGQPRRLAARLSSSSPRLYVETPTRDWDHEAWLHKPRTARRIDRCCTRALQPVSAASTRTWRTAGQAQRCRWIGGRCSRGRVQPVLPATEGSCRLQRLQAAVPAARACSWHLWSTARPVRHHHLAPSTGFEARELTLTAAPGPPAAVPQRGPSEEYPWTVAASRSCPKPG